MDSGPVGRARTRRPAVHHGVELSCSWRFEREAWGEGRIAVAGLDEVGRGALCGPVVAGAVILAEGFDTKGIDDSKRLTALQRRKLADRIRADGVAWALGCAEPDEIDRYNILRATFMAMRRALEALGRAPDLVLVDALTVPDFPCPQRAVVKGDCLSYSIAAASIVAKVARDAMMMDWDRRYPGYGLARNMGYASDDHRAAIRRLGPCAIHRQSFHGTQRWLFDLVDEPSGAGPTGN